jgi:hypothetical protein
MKRDAVKVGMVVWDKQFKSYGRVRKVEERIAWLKLGEAKYEDEWWSVWIKNLRPLTARERGER